MRVSEQYILEHFDEALEKGHIRTYYQPIFRTLTEKVCAAEALARWEDPELGMLSPLDFIEALEKHRLIYRLDLEMLRRTCALYRRLLANGTPVHSFSVNFSRLDFEAPDLFERVVATLAEYDVPHEAIKIEITESVMLENPDRFRLLFDAFQQAGFSVWIDDFGSGYSSLNVLQDYEFDLLKIDMVFLRNFSRRSRQVISSIVNMAKALGIHTLAEGVESPEQLRFLKSIGCEILQGYYYSKPLDEAALEALLAPENVESLEDKDYWNTAGLFNLLSANPLETFRSGGGDFLFRSDIPLALVECTWQGVNYVYASEEYLKRIHDLGFTSIDNLEHAFNDKINPRYGQLRRMILEAIARGTIQEMDYVTQDVFYTLKLLCIAKAKVKAIVAIYLRTFDSEPEMWQRNELAHYSQALYATYEHVNVLFPQKDSTLRIFSRANFQGAYQLGTLRNGIRTFCEKEICVKDQARYLRFFDLDTLEARIRQTEGGFIQQPFRINSDEREYEWRMIRITHIPSVLDEMYFYTIQKMSDVSIRVAEAMLWQHPELME